MYPSIFVLVIIVSLIFSSAVVAKKRCKPLLEKLHNIQAIQRSSYSSKGGQSLRKREDKARNNWWQCENGGGKKKKKPSKKSKKKSASYSTKTNKANRKKINAGTPFKTSNAVVVKSKYQGDKKRAWLAFYQQPKQCQRAKSLQVFALCSEDKQTQRADFEGQYNE